MFNVTDDGKIGPSSSYRHRHPLLAGGPGNTSKAFENMDKLQPIFDLIEGCDPKVSALAGVGALIVAKFALNVSGPFSVEGIICPKTAVAALECRRRGRELLEARAFVSHDGRFISNGFIASVLSAVSTSTLCMYSL